MYKLKLKHHFDAAHRLKLDYDSPCKATHGHRWLVEVIITTPALNKNGLVIDFKDIKSIINELDHKNLNDVFEFNPTAENISKHLYDAIGAYFNNEVGQKVRQEVLIEVTVWESPNASVTYGI